MKIEQTRRAGKRQNGTKRVFGLQHVKRSADEIQQIVEAAGFRTIDQVTEPMKIYPIITVVKE
ncbi:hypothetical protein [uncultured Gimesia sp.]|uniref:hypothetical protein n=1 Tax=uncultured Gimesia sp. TaxID=1678688 RepID=UPI0030D94433